MNTTKDDQNEKRKLNNYRVALASGAVAAVGIGLLYVAGRDDWWKGMAGLQSLINSLGGLLVVTGLLSIVWDLMGKRSFADEVLAKARVATDIKTAGVERISMQYLDDVDWTDLLASAHDIEICVAYAQSWRRVHWTEIEGAARRGAALRIYLPDPDDEATVRTLATRFDATPEKLKSTIEDAAKEYASLIDGGNGNVRIYFRKGDPVFSFYRFDNRVIATLYSHTRRRGQVPTFVVGQGTLFNFFLAELQAVRQQSTAYEPTAEGGER